MIMLARTGTSIPTIINTVAPCLCEKKQWLSRRQKGTEEEYWVAPMSLCCDGSFNPDDHELCGSVPL
jgi:hypothetical protein